MSKVTAAVCAAVLVATGSDAAGHMTSQGMPEWDSWGDDGLHTEAYWKMAGGNYTVTVPGSLSMSQWQGGAPCQAWAVEGENLDVHACIWSVVSRVCRTGVTPVTGLPPPTQKSSGLHKVPWLPLTVGDSNNRTHLSATDSMQLCSIDAFKCRSLVHWWSSVVAPPPTTRYAPVIQAYMETLAGGCRYRQNDDGLWRRLAAKKFVRAAYTVLNATGVATGGERQQKERLLRLFFADEITKSPESDPLRATHVRARLERMEDSGRVHFELVHQCFDDCTNRPGLPYCTTCTDAQSRATEWVAAATSIQSFSQVMGWPTPSFVSAMVFESPELDLNATAFVPSRPTYQAMTTFGADALTQEWCLPLMTAFVITVLMCVLSVVLAESPCAVDFAPEKREDNPYSRWWLFITWKCEAFVYMLSTFCFIRFVQNWLLFGNWFFAALAGFAIFIVGGLIVSLRVERSRDRASWWENMWITVGCILQMHHMVALSKAFCSRRGFKALGQIMSFRGPFLCPLLAFCCLYSVMLSTTPPVVPMYAVESAFPSYTPAEATFRLVAGLVLCLSAAFSSCFAKRGGEFEGQKGWFCFAYWSCENFFRVSTFVILGFVTIDEGSQQARHCAKYLCVYVLCDFILTWLLLWASRGGCGPRSIGLTFVNTFSVYVSNSRRFEESREMALFNRAVLPLRFVQIIVAVIVASESQPFPEPVLEHLEFNPVVKALMGLGQAAGGVWLVMDALARVMWDQRPAMTDREVLKRLPQSDTDEESSEESD